MRVRLSHMLIALATIAAVAYFGLAFALAQVTSNARETCDRGNSGRVTDLRDAQDETSIAAQQIVYWTLKDDPAQLRIWEGKAEGQAARIDRLKAVAQESGFATAADAVTILCDRANPDLLPLP